MLLEAAGVQVTVCPIDVDETVRRGESAAAYVTRLALAKARAGAERCGTSPPVLGADTTIAWNDMLLGKPADTEAAAEALRALSGGTHEAVAGVAVLGRGEQTAVVRTRVTFRELTEEAITAYCASGEPVGRAGSYAIQGLGGLLVARLKGDYSNVVGLPLGTALRLLGEARQERERTG